MPDLNEILVEEQRTYAELREEFRAENLVRIHSRLKQHPLGWGVLSDLPARDKYASEAWAVEMLRHLDQPVILDFGLGSVPFTESLKLEELAQKALLHDSATWEEGTAGVRDLDAPACDLDSMTEDEVCDYVNTAIEVSRGQK